ncbi:MAG: hypothetical protein WDO14_24365 [Bacteroidota bacterium]
MRTLVTLFVLASMAVTFSTCSLTDLKPKTPRQKKIDLFTEGDGIWNVDSLTLATIEQGTTTSDSVFLHNGTLEFKAPSTTDADPGNGIGFLIHRYTKKGVAVVDSLAWAPYSFASVSDETNITFFFPQPFHPIDYTSNVAVSVLNPAILESGKVRLFGLRQTTNNSGAVVGLYLDYYLTR